MRTMWTKKGPVPITRRRAEYLDMGNGTYWDRRDTNYYQQFRKVGQSTEEWERECEASRETSEEFFGVVAD